MNNQIRRQAYLLNDPESVPVRKLGTGSKRDPLSTMTFVMNCGE
jgi:hypothetical protein